MGLEAFDHLFPDREHRVQGHHRILKDHRNAVATDASQAAILHARQLLAVEGDATAGDIAGLGDQVQQAEGRDRLACPGLTDDPQSLAAIEAETDVAQGAYVAAAQGETNVEVIHFQKCHG